MWFLLLSVKQNIPSLCVRVSDRGRRGCQTESCGKVVCSWTDSFSCPEALALPKAWHCGANKPHRRKKKKIPAAGLSNSSNLWECNCSLRTVNK